MSSIEAPPAAPPAKSLALGKAVAFSSLSMPLSALGLAIAVYLGPHFSTHLGVSLTMIGAAWFTVRMLDLAVDVGLAAMMDRTSTPFGRYRVWLVAGAPIITLAVWMLFIAAPRNFSSVWLVGWLLGWTPFLQNKVRATAMGGLRKFIGEHAEYQ